jgi:hypothetical protein
MRTFTSNDEFFLDLIVPKGEFWSLFQWLCAHTRSNVTLNVTAQIAVFRSDADRGLEDWDDPRRYYVERISAACMSNISLALFPKMGSVNSKHHSIDQNNLGWQAVASAKSSSFSPIVKWMKLLFLGLVVLIFVEVLNG